MADSQALWRMWKAADGNAAGGPLGMSPSDSPLVDDDFDATLLAAYAEGNLDADEHALVADLLAVDRELAADVAAAAAPIETSDIALDAIIARAQALVAAPSETIVPFRPSRQKHVASGSTSWRYARWGSLAASLAVVSWLGFALGNDAYGSLATLELRANAPAGVADELLDPPAGFFDPSEADGT